MVSLIKEIACINEGSAPFTVSLPPTSLTLNCHRRDCLVVYGGRVRIDVG